jgi:DNA-binding transcriptional regulator GbsR (MarR family)
MACCSWPLALDDLIEQPNMSKGGTSMGLRFLRNAGAVKIVHVAGDRRLHYEAVVELRNLAARFVRHQILPHLDSGLKRLEHNCLPRNERVSAPALRRSSAGKRRRVGFCRSF